jgi:metal-responsive CopG/Arc/MetJ family transcriptional regulator
MKQFSIALDDALAKKIDEQAKENGRSRTKEIERILKAYFDAKK